VVSESTDGRTEIWAPLNLKAFDGFGDSTDIELTFRKEDKPRIVNDNGFNCEQLTEITVSALNTHFYSSDGVVFDKEEKCLIEYPRNKDKTDYAVPDGILYIDNEAFSGCKRLVNITLPESIRVICDYAFLGCEGLKAITLPMNLLYVGERAFEDCPNLETVTLSRKTKIGHRAFEGFKGRLVYRD
jgi:hypothetical protein